MGWPQHAAQRPAATIPTSTTEHHDSTITKPTNQHSPTTAHTANQGATNPHRNLSPRKLHPLLEEKDLKNDRPNNYFFWTFATHMAQIPPKKYNFTQFAAFFHFLLIKINYYFV